MKWKIIADSGCDYRSLDNLAPDTEFVSVPLTIQVGETIYRDDAQLNIDQMMEEMYATTTASKSACPSPDDYMKSLEGGQYRRRRLLNPSGMRKSLRKFILKNILKPRFTSLIACQLGARSTCSFVSSIA